MSWAHAVGWSTPATGGGQETGHKVIASSELDRFIPVVLAGIPCNGIVARHTSEHHFPSNRPSGRRRWTVPRAVGGQVKVPLLRRKTYGDHPFSKIVMPVPVRQVGSGNMVGNKIHHRQQPHRPATLYQSLELIHSLLREEARSDPRQNNPPRHRDFLPGLYDGFRLGGQPGMGRLRSVPQHPGQPDVCEPPSVLFHVRLYPSPVKSSAPVRFPAPQSTPWVSILEK